MATSRTQTVVTIFLMFDLLFMTAVVLSASAGSRNLLSEESEAEKVLGDAQDQITDFTDTVWGAKCISDDNCSFISFCKMGDIPLIGECQIIWWAYVVVGVIVLLLLSCCISCICCPCCFLFHCCSKILDCLCCCCRSKGYSPAGRG